MLSPAARNGEIFVASGYQRPRNPYALREQSPASGIADFGAGDRPPAQPGGDLGAAQERPAQRDAIGGDARAREPVDGEGAGHAGGLGLVNPALDAGGAGCLGGDDLLPALGGQPAVEPLEPAGAPQLLRGGAVVVGIQRAGLLARILRHDFDQRLRARGGRHGHRRRRDEGQHGDHPPDVHGVPPANNSTDLPVERATTFGSRCSGTKSNVPASCSTPVRSTRGG